MESGELILLVSDRNDKFRCKVVGFQLGRNPVTASSSTSSTSRMPVKPESGIHKSE